MEPKSKYSTTGLRRLFNATGYSYKGIRAALESEAAVRQEFMLSLILVPAAFFLAQTLSQLILLLLSVLLVIVIELLNTSVEYAIDRIGTEHHELSGKAKDIASAAVFSDWSNS